MNNELKNTGFSLTEVLLAVGTLAIGLIFVGGTFLAGIHLSTIATERTIAAIAADEAFAKIKLIVADPYCPIDANAFDLANLKSFEEEVNAIRILAGAGYIDPNEFAYPSTRTDLAEKQYFWSALCRQVEPDPNQLVQVRVFVCRKVGSGTKYRNPADPLNLDDIIDYPMPLPINVSGTVGSYVLTIEEADKISWINDGDTIVENTTGEIYRVIKRRADVLDRIELDRPWDPEDTYPEPNDIVWVVPPPVGSGRKPCITVYPNEIRF